MRSCKDIDATPENGICGDERLMRLLCTPQFYNKETRQVNMDAFDLRLLQNGMKEEYVSLFRLVRCDDETLQCVIKKGYAIWDKKKNSPNLYFGYGTMVCDDAKRISDKIEIWPLNGQLYHIGMFYAKNENEYYKGPLPKTDPGIVDMLSALAALLDDTVTAVVDNN